MEILNTDLTTLAFQLGLAITALALLMLVIITVIHWLTDRRLDQSMLFDRYKRPMIMSYLEGNTPKLTVIRAIEKEPSQAMHLLLDIARKLQPDTQARLLPIFASLPGVGKETDAVHSMLTKRRLAAAERLGLLQTDASDQALLEALQDEVLAVRYCAAYSLAEHRNADFIEPTLLAFDAEHEINWYRLVEIMVEYGTNGISTLLRIVENPTGKHSSNIINVAIRALGVLKANEAVEPLIALLKSSDQSIRLNAAHALGDIGDPSAVAALAKLSHDPTSEVRADAIEAMGKLQADRNLEDLVSALADPSWWVRYTAAQALHAIGTPGIELLWQTMRSTHDPYVYDICRDVISEQETHKRAAQHPVADDEDEVPTGPVLNLEPGPI